MSEKKEGKISPIELTVYVKKMTPMALKGIVSHTGDSLSVEGCLVSKGEEIDNGHHAFSVEDLSLVVTDNVAGRTFEGTMEHHKIMTRSGSMIGFNGGGLDCSDYGNVQNMYLTDKDDVIIIYEDVSYAYVGPIVDDEQIKPKEEIVENGEELPQGQEG